MIKFLDAATANLRYMFASAGVESVRVILETPNDEAKYVLQSWMMQNAQLRDSVPAMPDPRKSMFDDLRINGLPVKIRTRPRETARLAADDVLAMRRALRAALFEIETSGLTKSVSDHEAGGALACIDIIDRLMASLPYVE